MIHANTSPTSVPGESAVRHVGAFFSASTSSSSTRPLKPFSEAQQQIALLRSRGLEVHDEAAARSALQRLGYYRLSGYAHAMKLDAAKVDPAHAEFKPGATFPLLVQLADFDKSMRLLVLDGLEVIEIAVRAAVVARLGRVDVEAHRNPALLDGRFTASVSGHPSNHDEWLQRFDLLFSRSKEDLVEHHRLHYGARMPIWAALEIVEFGMLSKLVAGLQHRDRNAIARQFGTGHSGVLTSWLHAFNVTRNRAAHHARLWNRANARAPLLPAPGENNDLAFLHSDEMARKRLFGTLCCMRSMIRAIAPGSSWHIELKRLLNSFPTASSLSIRSAGFPANWEQLPLWSD